MSPDNEVNLKRVLRVFRNAIVDHIRDRLRVAFNEQAEDKLGTLYGKKDPDSGLTQWQRMKVNADRARATPEISTSVVDDFELLGVSDFHNIFERFYQELYRPIEKGEDPAIFNDKKKGLLRCLQQIKAYRDPNAHDVTEAIDSDSLLLCIINCKKVCAELLLAKPKQVLEELHIELSDGAARKHATLASLYPDSETTELSRKCLAQAGATYDGCLPSDLGPSGRMGSVLADISNLILTIEAKDGNALNERELSVLQCSLDACARHGVTPHVLLSHRIDEATLSGALGDDALRVFKRAERLPLVSAYVESTAKRLRQILRPSPICRQTRFAAAAVPTAHAIHDEKLAPRIFAMIRDPALISARIVAPFATDIHGGTLGILSDAMIQAKNRGCKVCLITRPPAPGDKDLLPKRLFLKKLHEEQIELYLNPQVHAKVYLFEREANLKFWAVGSHNLSNFAHGGKSLETSMIGYRTQEFDEAQTSFERARRHSETIHFTSWITQQTNNSF